MQGRRSNRKKGAFGALAAALIVGLAVLALVSVVGSSGADASSDKAGGVPYSPGKAGQEGLTLGDPGAPVDLYEYCDLESPICRQFAEVVLPKVIRDEVDTGKAQVTFRNFMIMGPGSPAAAAAAIAAGEQGDGWSFVEAFYRGRGKRDAGSAGDAYLEATATAAGVEDLARWNAARASQAVQAQAKASTKEAEGLGLIGTPSFAVKGPGTDGLQVVEGPEKIRQTSAVVAALEGAIDQAAG
ncbi:MAG TPA: thioredoxin domain-containing protein [Solirubrobacterales bacterium]|nr:thioredoxin domain-containing protein [Solirubrobacterales bacterium]